MEDGYIYIIIFIAVIVVWLLLRDVACWYYKINKRVEQNDRIIELLKEIANKMNDTPGNTGQTNFTGEKKRDLNNPEVLNDLLSRVKKTE